jgi:hypothetical protein
MLDRILTRHPETRRMRILTGTLVTGGALVTATLAGVGPEVLNDGVEAGGTALEWVHDHVGGDPESDSQGMAPTEATLSLNGIASNVSQQVVEAPLAVPVVVEV